MKKIAIPVLLWAILSPAQARADDASVLNFEGRLRRRDILDFYQSNPNGINHYRIPYEPDIAGLFTVESHLISPAVIDEIGTNTFLAQEEKSVILGYAEKINRLLQGSEEAEVAIYTRISNALPQEIKSKEEYSRAVRGIVNVGELDGLFAEQIKFWELAIEMLDYVRKTDAYRTKLSDTEKKDLLHTINNGADTDAKLAGYFRTRMELIKIRKKSWDKVYR